MKELRANKIKQKRGREREKEIGGEGRENKGKERKKINE